MKWIGLTGGIASGKSTVTQILRELSYNVVDADEIAHEVVAPGTPGLKSIVANFGPEILNPGGSLARRELGKRVFGSPVNLQKLEGILHPLIRARIEEIKNQWIAQNVEVAFYDVPLLFEKNMQKDFSAVVVVDCPREMQIERLKKRNNLSESEIQMRMASQLPLATKTAQADFVIHNEKGIDELRAEVSRMLAFIKGLKK
jgi:dephospho-CoA kinase